MEQEMWYSIFSNDNLTSIFADYTIALVFFYYFWKAVQEETDSTFLRLIGQAIAAVKEKMFGKKEG